MFFSRSVANRDVTFFSRTAAIKRLRMLTRAPLVKQKAWIAPAPASPLWGQAIRLGSLPSKSWPLQAARPSLLSRPGGSPNMRPYSRVNCVTLS